MSSTMPCGSRMLGDAALGQPANPPRRYLPRARSCTGTLMDRCWHLSAALLAWVPRASRASAGLSSFSCSPLLSHELYWDGCKSLCTEWGSAPSSKGWKEPEGHKRGFTGCGVASGLAELPPERAGCCCWKMR